MNAQHASKKDFSRFNNPIMIESQDDGIALVKEVLEDNPPEERGVRDEWKHQVGWHRKEDINPGASTNQLRGSAPSRRPQQEKENGIVNADPTTSLKPSASRTAFGLLTMAAFVACILMAMSKLCRHRFPLHGVRTKKR
jgi:hypothetical protein